MKRLSKVLSILLILSLVLPGFAFANEDVSIEREKIYKDLKARLKEDPLTIVDRNAADEYFDAEEEVRIIVELESKPSIVYATERNMSYKELSNAKEIERNIEIEQEKVKEAIISSNIEMEFIHSLKVAFNGFSGIVQYKDIEKIEKLPSVKKVYIANEYERPEPDLGSSHDLIGSIPTWDIGYEGEGTVIAIIDTGIDPSHKDMVLSEDTVPALTKEDVESIIEEENLLGKYYTEKVPYGYNYYDLNDEIRDLGPGASEHGMHVAGIAAANGDVENGGVRGVAPEAQLLAMKVFSNDPIYGTTFSDIYLVAIDEAIKLGADVLNMSLGSAASFYIPDSAENIAITNATDNGIVCSVSAGNAGQLTYGWDLADPTYLGYPWKENPDIGVVGSPGLNKDTIQVASIENIYTKANYLTYEEDGKEYKVPMAIAGNINPTDVFDGPVEYADGGSGHPSELTEVEGKIALIIRGGLTSPFVEKIENAQNAGAIGVIVYNHEAGGEELVNMATPDVQRIPAVFIGHSAGLKLLELEEKYVTFADDLMTIPNPSAGLMSEFSSWGTTPSLELKPEITAPGGEIYSTLNNNRYGMMSGTSMAAPHVAGGAALVMEYIKEHDEFKNLPPSEQTRLAKVILMNTATIVYDEYGWEYSPRRQGAGLMNLYGAVSTPVRLVDVTTNEAKVELKDFEETSFTMEFKAINHSDTDATYNVDVIVLKDYIYPYAGKELNLLSSDYIYEATIDKPETITVPANSEITFEVTVDIGTDSTIYRNMFVEGFVKLTDPNDENPELSVPYVGFYGNWAEPKILDGMRFIDPVGTSYFNSSGMLMVDIEGYAYYYSTPGRIYMSPGTLDGFINGSDNVLPYLSFLRNAEYVKYNILDAEGNHLRTIAIQEYYRKDYVNGGRNNPVALVMDAWWFGDVNGEILPDGDYFYEIEAKIHYDDAEAQYKRIPITIDTVMPEIANLEFDPETNKISFNVVEESSGILGFIVYINGEVVDEIPVLVDEDELLFELDVTNYVGRNIVEIIVADNAYNIGYAAITADVDNPDAYIYLLKPLLLEVYDESDVLVEGYVARFELLDKVLIDGEEADIEYIEHVNITHPEDPSTILYSGPAYKFTKLMTYEDGYIEMKVEAISETGARSSITRRFFVDTTPPELEVIVTNVDADSNTADLRIRMFDNLGTIKLYLGDSQIYLYEEPLVSPDPQEIVIDYTVELEDGVNTLIFTLVDYVGHSTTVEVVIDTESIITNVQPSENLYVKAGDQVLISFNAPSGGEGYYKIMLPFNLNNVNGIPMEETEPGLYTATWIVPDDLVASGLQVEVIYVAVDGTQHTKFAEGKITIVGDMEDLPVNAVIVNGEAYDINYLNSNPDVQMKVINWINDGNEIYVKLDDNTIVTQDGKLVSIDDLPDRLTYYDEDGNRYIFEK